MHTGLLARGLSTVWGDAADGGGSSHGMNAAEGLGPFGGSPGGGAPKALGEAVRRTARLRRLSPRTERVYAHWIRRFVAHHGGRRPAELGAEHVTELLGALATDGSVSASTQNQALAALLFLSGDVYGRDLPWLGTVVPAKRPIRVPVVLSRTDVGRVLDGMDGVPRLLATLLYGSGLGLLECCQSAFRGSRRVRKLDSQFGAVSGLMKHVAQTYFADPKTAALNVLWG